MSTINEQKRKVAVKLLEMQKKGLVQYGKYLDQQLKYSSGKTIRTAYTKYIKNQVTLNNDRIRKIDARLARYFL